MMCILVVYGVLRINKDPLNTFRCSVYKSTEIHPSFLQIQSHQPTPITHYKFLVLQRPRRGAGEPRRNHRPVNNIPDRLQVQLLSVNTEVLNPSVLPDIDVQQRYSPVGSCDRRIFDSVGGLADRKIRRGVHIGLLAAVGSSVGCTGVVGANNTEVFRLVENKPHPSVSEHLLSGGKELGLERLRGGPGPGDQREELLGHLGGDRGLFNYISNKFIY